MIRFGQEESVTHVVTAPGGTYRLCWCGNGETSPCGTYDRPTGHARPDSKHGEIGDLVLSWLRLFVLNQTVGEEILMGTMLEDGANTGGTRSAAVKRLQARPGIASGFACEKKISASR